MATKQGKPMAGGGMMPPGMAKRPMGKGMPPGIAKKQMPMMPKPGEAMGGAAPLKRAAAPPRKYRMGLK